MAHKVQNYNERVLRKYYLPALLIVLAIAVLAILALQYFAPDHDNTPQVTVIISFASFIVLQIREMKKTDVAINSRLDEIKRLEYQAGKVKGAAEQKARTNRTRQSVIKQRKR